MANSFDIEVSEPKRIPLICGFYFAEGGNSSLAIHLAVREKNL